MKIDVLGCGSAFSCTQNTSALRVIDADNKQWLIDCGPTVPRALWQRGGEVNDIDAIWMLDMSAGSKSALFMADKTLGKRKDD